MKTVKIKPVTSFVNGKQMTATALNVVSIKDNLIDHVVFKYTLFTAKDEYAGEAVFELGPDTYNSWDASVDGAYNIVAKGIGVELVAEGGV